MHSPQGSCAPAGQGNHSSAEPELFCCPRGGQGRGSHCRCWLLGWELCRRAPCRCPCSPFVPGSSRAAAQGLFGRWVPRAALRQRPLESGACGCETGRWVFVALVGFCSLALPALGLFPLPRAGWKEMPTAAREASMRHGSAPGALSLGGLREARLQPSLVMSRARAFCRAELLLGHEQAEL